MPRPPTWCLEPRALHRMTLASAILISVSFPARGRILERRVAHEADVGGARAGDEADEWPLPE